MSYSDKDWWQKQDNDEQWLRENDAQLEETIMDTNTEDSFENWKTALSKSEAEHQKRNKEEITMPDFHVWANETRGDGVSIEIALQEAFDQGKSLGNREGYERGKRDGYVLGSDFNWGAGPKTGCNMPKCNNKEFCGGKK